MEVLRKSNSSQLGDFWEKVKEVGSGPEYLEDESSAQRSIGKAGAILQLLLLIGTIALIVNRRYGRRAKGGRDARNGREGDREKKLVPVATSIFPIPIVDALYNLFQVNKYGLKFFEWQANKYGKCFEMPLGLAPVYCISDPKIVQTLLTSTSPKNLNKPKELDKIFPKGFLADMFFTSDMDSWTPQKQILNRSFTPDSLQSYLKIMNGNGRRMTQEMLWSVSSAGEFEGDILAEIDYNTVKIIAETIFGPNITVDHELEAFLNTYKATKQIVLERSRKPYLLIDAVWRSHSTKKKMDKNIKLMWGFILDIINAYKRKIEREQELEELKLKEGLIETIETVESEVGTMKPFRSMMEEMLRGGMSDKEIENEVVGITLAGHDSTSMALKSLMFHLALHPEYQQKCREEVDHLVESKMARDNDFDCELTMEDVDGMKYLERCILENLRLVPPFPVQIRKLDAPLNLELEGTAKNVLILTWCINRNAEYYPNPEAFDPDRPQSQAKTSTCLGMEMAMNEMKITMHWILRNFEIHTTDKIKDVTYRVDATLQPMKPYNLILKRRTGALGG